MKPYLSHTQRKTTDRFSPKYPALQILEFTEARSCCWIIFLLQQQALMCNHLVTFKLPIVLGEGSFQTFAQFSTSFLEVLWATYTSQGNLQKYSLGQALRSPVLTPCKIISNISSLLEHQVRIKILAHQLQFRPFPHVPVFVMSSIMKLIENQTHRLLFWKNPQLYLPKKSVKVNEKAQVTEKPSHTAQAQIHHIHFQGGTASWSSTTLQQISRLYCTVLSWISALVYFDSLSLMSWLHLKFEAVWRKAIQKAFAVCFARMLSWQLSCAKNPAAH